MKRKAKRKARPPQASGEAPEPRPREQFQVEFQFFDPEEGDFHSVRDLLCSGTLGFADLDFSGLANCIVDQVNIGTMVKSGAETAETNGPEDDDVTLCGILTVLNLRQFKDQPWCKSLTDLLKSKLKGKLDKQLSSQLLKYIRGEDQVGLMISERFVNLPLEIIPAMHHAILEDIQWSCTTEYCPAEERPFYFFTDFLCLARCQAVASAEGDTLQLQNGTSLHFARAEDLALARTASFVISFARDGSHKSNQKKRKLEGAPKGQEHLAILGMTREAYEKAVRNMREALRNA